MFLSQNWFCIDTVHWLLTRLGPRYNLPNRAHPLCQPLGAIWWTHLSTTPGYWFSRPPYCERKWPEDEEHTLLPLLPRGGNPKTSKNYMLSQGKNGIPILVIWNFHIHYHYERCNSSRSLELARGVKSYLLNIGKKNIRNHFYIVPRDPTSEEHPLKCHRNYVARKFGANFSMTRAWLGENQMIAHIRQKSEDFENLWDTTKIGFHQFLKRIPVGFYSFQWTQRTRYCLQPGHDESFQGATHQFGNLTPHQIDLTRGVFFSK